MEAADGVQPSTMQRRCERLRETIADHRRRTEQERAAFEQFRRDVVAVADQLDHEPSDEQVINSVGTDTVVTSWTRPLMTAAASTQKQVREAFAGTIMALPFYDEEYGESLPDAIEGEFGPSVAAGLTESDCFGRHLIVGLLDGIKQSQRAREVLLETCDREREAIDALAAKLPGFARELAQVDALHLATNDFGALEAHWRRLETITTQCGRLATRRQRVISRQRAQYQLAAEEPDIYEYLYRGYPVAYPMLAMITTTIAAVRDRQRGLTGAMGDCDG